MRINLLTLSCIAHGCLVLAATTSESPQVTLQCFQFFHSLKKQSLDFTLHSADDDKHAEESKTLVTISKGSNFRAGVDYNSLAKYFCTEELVNAEVCTQEEIGFPLTKVMFKDDDLAYKQVLTKSKNYMVFDQIDETLSYCVLTEKIPDVNLIITPHFDGNLDGKLKVLRSTDMFKVLVGLVLTLVYVKQWKGTELKMDNLNKSMTLYFEYVHAVVPGLELIGLAFASWHLFTLYSVVKFVLALTLFAAYLANVVFVTLLLRGYTLLPEAEYPLVSRHYLPVAVSLSLIAIFSLLALISPSTFSPVLLIFSVGVYVYQVVQFYKTNKLLKSLSLRSSARRSQTLKLLLFYLPLSYIVLGIAAAVSIAITSPSPEEITSAFSPVMWRPTEELVGQVLVGLVLALIDFAILMRYWTPAAIYADSFGFEPSTGTEI